MRDLTEIKLTEGWFFENGYWTYGDEGTVLDTEKWRELFDTCYNKTFTAFTENGRRFRRHGIITPELLVETIREGSVRRDKNIYRRAKPKPEGYMTVKQKREASRLKKSQKKETELKNANRNPQRKPAPDRS